MGQCRLSRRRGAIIALLIVPVLLLGLCATALGQAPILSYGFQGDGIFPTFATTNSMYWVRVTYDDNDNDAIDSETGLPDPIIRFRFENRSPGTISPSIVSLLPFLVPTGDSYQRGIMLSPTASSLAGGAGQFTTTGSRSDVFLMVASSLDPLVNYTGADIRILTGPHATRTTRVADQDTYGILSRTATADAQGFGPMWTTATASDAFTMLSNQLPAGDWSGGRVRITAPQGSPVVGETRAIDTYDDVAGVLTIDPAGSPFFMNVPANTEFVLIGPYTTTADGTNMAMVCDHLPGTPGQYVGGRVRITGPTGNPLVGESSEIVTYNPLSNLIVVASSFSQPVTTGVEFELDGFTVVDRGLGAPAPLETWEGAQITITQDPHAALGQARNVVAWSPETGTFRVDRPFRGRIVSGDAYDIVLIMLVHGDVFAPPIAAYEDFLVLAAGLGIPNWYLNGTDFAWSGMAADGKIVVDAEDDANRDGDVLDPGDNPPGLWNRPDFYLFMSVVASDHVRFSVGPWTVDHGLFCKG